MHKKFLEEYPLYRRFSIDVHSTLDRIEKPAINMMCKHCKSKQTFNMENEYPNRFNYSNPRSKGTIVDAIYRCTSCGIFEYFFLLRIEDDLKAVRKVGQWPAWDISVDHDLEALLGNHAHYFSNGLICESQSFGMGAFAYYRRIVEEVIDNLLEQIAGLLNGSELETYRAALEKTKQTRVTAEKIDLVKDLLPSVLRPADMNPLAALHTSLSEGLHENSDERCLELAEAVRVVLVFLASQIARAKTDRQTYTDSMRKLLDRKNQKDD
jgi:hypothetical protein